MKRILMIAYHFPPMAGSSGIQRTLRFVQQLPALGWEPLVLSLDPRAYERTSNDLAREVPPDTVVRRAFALDAARHLSIKGRYPGWFARPDRWINWRFAGVREGMRMIREFSPQIIWSTYPIATAHVIGAELHRRSGLPWIADFRDPMAQDGYPADPRAWRSFKRIEENAAGAAARCVFTTPGAVREYRKRYPQAASRMVLIENGYDEESFAGRAQASPAAPPGGRRIVLLHSGIVYPQERDPTQLFVALKRLRDAGRLLPRDLVVRFRASAHDDNIRALARRENVEDFIELCPPIPYREALAEMLETDALLVMQDRGCNDQIPAKVYEYLRAGRPILGITDPDGDTGGVLRGAGVHHVARLESSEEIEAILPVFIDAVVAGRVPPPDAGYVATASRLARSREMAALCEQVGAESGQR